MPLYSPSSKAVSATVQEIADTIGASADAVMTPKALRSLNAAIKHFNGRAKWNFLYTEADPIIVTAPFTIAVTASSQQASASALTGHGVQTDDIVVGSGIGLGTRVSATGASGFGFSRSFAVMASGLQNFNLTFTRDMYSVPAGFRTPYSLRLLVTNKPLYPLVRRMYDRSWSDQFGASTVAWYDTFPVGAKGKIRLVPPPDTSDVLDLRYYRSIATASATGVSAVLDLPSDYDDYVVAWGKWHFLTDRGEGRTEQATSWLALANEGLATMLRDQTAQPDDDVGFVPGHSGWSLGPNSFGFTD